MSVTLAGWVQTMRKFGSITFVDLRDRYGITQLLFGEELNKELVDNPPGREFVLQVKGSGSGTGQQEPAVADGGYRDQGDRLYDPEQIGHSAVYHPG